MKNTLTPSHKKKTFRSFLFSVCCSIFVSFIILRFLFIYFVSIEQESSQPRSKKHNEVKKVRNTKTSWRSKRELFFLFWCTVCCGIRSFYFLQFFFELSIFHFCDFTFQSLGFWACWLFFSEYFMVYTCQNKRYNPSNKSPSKQQINPKDQQNISFSYECHNNRKHPKNK